MSQRPLLNIKKVRELFAVEYSKGADTSADIQPEILEYVNYLVEDENKRRRHEPVSEAVHMERLRTYEDRLTELLGEKGYKQVNAAAIHAISAHENDIAGFSHVKARTKREMTLKGL